LGYIRTVATVDRNDVQTLGVVISITAGRLMPTQSEFEKILREAESRKDKDPPTSPRQVRIFNPSLFTFEFDSGKRLPVNAFLTVVKGPPELLRAHRVSLSVQAPQAYDLDEVLEICLGIAGIEEQLGLPRRLRFRDDTVVDIPRKPFTVARLPAATPELAQLDSFHNIHVPTLPNFNVPQFKPPTVPTIPKVPSVPKLGTNGNSRGGVNDSPAKIPPRNAAKNKPKTTAKEKRPPIDVNPETAAANKLKLAKGLMSQNKAAARKRLEEITAEFDGTEAAREASEILKGL